MANLAMNYHQFNNTVLNFYLHRNQTSFCYLGISEEEFTSITELDSILGFSEIRESWSRLLTFRFGIPQFFGLLAIQCLAGSLMEAEGELSRNAYQVRLIRLAGVGSSSHLQTLFSESVNGRSVQETIWNAAQEYLMANHFRKLTIPATKTHRGRYIQFPLSQVLLDREDLKSFNTFFSKQYIAGENIGFIDFAERLDAIFLDNSVSRRAIFMLTDEEKKDSVTRQIFNYYLYWDGTTTISKGSSVVKSATGNYQSLILCFTNERPEFYLFPSIKIIKLEDLWNGVDFLSFHKHLKIFNSHDYYKNEFQEQRFVIPGKAAWILLNRLYWRSAFEYAISRNFKQVKISEHIYLFHLEPNYKSTFYPFAKLFASQAPIILAGGLKVGRSNSYIQGFGPNVIANYTFKVFFNEGVCQYSSEHAKVGQYRIQTENFRDVTFTIIPAIEIFSTIPSRKSGWDLTSMSLSPAGNLEGAAINTSNKRTTLQMWRKLQVTISIKKHIIISKSFCVFCRNKMGKLIKIIGIVEEARGANHARVRVMAYKKGHEYVFDREDLEQVFQPHGCVHIRNILTRFSIGTLIEAPVTFNEPHPNNDHYKCDNPYGQDCRPVGYRFFFVSKGIRPMTRHLDLLEIQEEIDTPILPNEFYIVQESKIYGPLSSDTNTIYPKLEVGASDLSNTTVVSSSGFHYFLSKPIAAGKIDTMNIEQLSEWFKTKLKPLTSTFDIDELARLLLNSDFNGIEKMRLNRVISNFMQIKLGKVELAMLAENSRNLRASYETAIDKVRNEFITPALEEAAQVRRTIEEKQAELQLLQETLYNVNQSIKTLNSDIEYLNFNRDKLIMDVRVHSMVNSENHLNKFPKFEVVDYCRDTGAVADIITFVQAYFKEYQVTDATKKEQIFLSFAQFKNYRAILAHKPETVMHIADTTGNAKVILQHVELDWIKYEHLYANGFKYAIEAASAAPSEIFFFVLQNCNFSSVECYAAELLDYINGVRKTLPGTQAPLPNNLWLFFIPMRIPSSVEFGLPLIRDSYESWGVLPQLNIIPSMESIQKSRISVSELVNHDFNFTPSIEDFFDELSQ